MDNFFQVFLSNLFKFAKFILDKTKIVSVALFVYFLGYAMRKLALIENNYMLIILIIYLPILFSQIKLHIIKSNSAKRYWRKKFEIEKSEKNNVSSGLYEEWNGPSSVNDASVLISVIALGMFILSYLTISGNDEAMQIQAKGLIFMLIFGFGLINIHR